MSYLKYLINFISFIIDQYTIIFIFLSFLFRFIVIKIKINNYFMKRYYLINVIKPAFLIKFFEFVYLLMSSIINNHKFKFTLIILFLNSLL